jgi:hypothetical protein
MRLTSRVMQSMRCLCARADPPPDFADDVLALEPLHTPIQGDVVAVIVVALGEQQLGGVSARVSESAGPDSRRPAAKAQAPVARGVMEGCRTQSDLREMRFNDAVHYRDVAAGSVGHVSSTCYPVQLRVDARKHPASSIVSH